MTSVLPGIAACLLYLASLAAQLFALHEGGSRVRALQLSRMLAAPALLLHMLSLSPALFAGDGLDFGLFNAGSLFFWMIATLTYIASWRLPLANLLLILYPLTVIALLCALFLHAPQAQLQHLGWGIGSHVLLSIMAYSILTIAAVQAAALGLLINRLKHRRLHGVVDMMPPLQTMESLLFRLIWTGEVLLALSLVTGAMFFENLFAQHLAHKTVLSIIAWLVFATLLWGRHQLGWRGITAIKWTLAGFSLLILAYFGSKIVLEFVLHRPGL
ncbi:MAG: cytochrome c biogenesis protein CcsA [Gammaproteobacteria bacterium]|nr:cytochrome c biogenesis protein CcsA [Gammaproteobacteria bacterium]MBK7728621.1 cytochrome c biogenesis protein CcsA [Gammaproteobacteria bacterium]